MGGIRVNPNLYLETLSALELTRQAEDTALEEVSTGKRVNTPSDGPAAAAANVGVQYEIDADDQYTQSISSITGALDTADTTLNSVVNLISEALSYGTEGGNSDLSQSNRDVLAQQIQDVESQIVTLGNTTYQGNYIFAGTATNTQPFVQDADDPTTVTYEGNSDTDTAQIASGESIQINLPGNQILAGTAANTNVFDALQQLAQTVQNGGDVTTAVANLQTAYNYVCAQRVFYGDTVNQLDSTETFLSSDKVQLSSQQNTLIGIDESQAATNLEEAETAREAALEAAGQIGQANLLNYLPDTT
jgi:flagellar hook-associated protein 3 FlgL